jgi:hypothetical protein
MSSIYRFLSVAAVVLLLLGLIVTQAGCAAMAAAGAAVGGVGYVNGDLEGYINSSVPKIVASSNAALLRLKHIKVKEEVDATTATITARTTDDTKITIRLKQATDTTTEISVRFGVFGDQQLSQVLMTEIRKGI